ncbi:MAG TPA: hybrid sensor histidine kinase/response regulator [Candidatus Binataceae bacterium]|nr:hybrid sensor histidine kinase/response regulator [Candidatus Binataceae bacterium]
MTRNEALDTYAWHGVVPSSAMNRRGFARDLTLRQLGFTLTMIALIATPVLLVLFRISLGDSLRLSNSILLQAQETRLSLRDTMHQTRAFVLAANDASLPDWEAARDSFRADLRNLARLLAEQAAPVQIGEISARANAWLAQIQPLVQGAGSRKESSVALDRALRDAHELDRRIASVVRVQYQIRGRERQRQSRQQAALLGFAALLSLLFGFSLVYWYRRLTREAHAQFALALERAEQAARIRERFISAVSHELRNPLNSIMLWCHAALADEELGAKARRGLQGIDQAARAQAQLIDDLLDLSRMEDGRIRLALEPTKPVEIVVEVIESFRAEAQAKAIAVASQLDYNTPAIQADPSRLRQIVSHLIAHAIKFTPNGGKLDVRLEAIDGGAQLTVADNGSGIDPAAIPWVFDSFGQGNVSRKLPGLGLGLALVKQLVTLHGGIVSAHSDGVGKGTVFKVWLPLPPPASMTPFAAPAPIAQEALSDQPLERLEGCAILVVDDEAAACDAMEELLGALGATVTTTTSAEGALALLDEMEFHVVISDIGMPVHDGLWLAAEIRRRERQSAAPTRVPLLALTAYGRSADRARALRSGFDHYLVKPAQLTELAALIRRLMHPEEQRHAQASRQG